MINNNCILFIYTAIKHKVGDNDYYVLIYIVRNYINMSTYIN